MPILCAISTQSANGKNASLAITAPFKSKPKLNALETACFKASTRDVCPVPLASNWLFFTITMVLDFVCFANLFANNKSFI